MLDFGLEFSEVQSGGYVTVVLVVLTSNLRKSNSGGKKVGGWLKVANFGLLNSVGRHRHSPRHVVSLFAGVSCHAD